MPNDGESNNGNEFLMNDALYHHGIKGSRVLKNTKYKKN
jgi:hypothetical protein